MNESADSVFFCLTPLAVAQFQRLAKAYVKLSAKQKKTLGNNAGATLVSSVLKESYASCVDDIFSSGLEKNTQRQ